MMMTRLFSLADQEPAPGLYARMARLRVFRQIYQRLGEDLAAVLPQQAYLLDVGTGPGYLLGFLTASRADLKPVGLDLSYQMLRQGRRFAGFTSREPFWAVVGKAQALPFTANTFHHVLATFSLHHWNKPSLGLTEINRVLKPNGKAWILELNPQAPRAEVRHFAECLKTPWLPLYLGYKLTSWHSALGAADFALILKDSGITDWCLDVVHHIFFRLEWTKTALNEDSPSQCRNHLP